MLLPLGPSTFRVTLLSTELEPWHTFQVGCVVPAGSTVGVELTALFVHLLAGGVGQPACFRTLTSQ